MVIHIEMFPCISPTTNRNYDYSLRTVQWKLDKILSLPYVISIYRRFASSATTDLKSLDRLNRLLWNVNDTAEKNGRIIRTDFDEIITNVKQNGSVTKEQSLMIIRCCGKKIVEIMSGVYDGFVRTTQCPLLFSHFSLLVPITICFKL